jgi:hypothetical protein
VVALSFVGAKQTKLAIEPPEIVNKRHLGPRRSYQSTSRSRAIRRIQRRRALEIAAVVIAPLLVIAAVVCALLL